MSLTAIAFLGIYLATLILAFARHPIYGLYCYMWAFYNNPSSRWWGEALPDARWSLIAAVVTLVATASAGRKLTMSDDVGQRTPASPIARDSGIATGNWGIRLLVLYVAWMWIQLGWAVNSDYQLEGCILFSKYVVLYYIMRWLIRNESALETFAWVHVLGCFMWGWIAYRTEVHGRMELNFGPGVDDSNAVGFHLTTGLAFAGLMFLNYRSTKRWIAFAAIPFILNAIVLTASRSALLAMVGAGVAVVWLAPKKHRGRILLCGALGVVLLLMLAKNDIFWDRAATIMVTKESEMDASAASRVVLARAGWRMALDYPFGAGHRGAEVLSSQYVPAALLNRDGVRSAHNTFVAVLVDQGFPGLMLFVGLHVWALSRFWGIKRLDRYGASQTVATYRAAIGASMAAYFVTGLFINLLKAEIGIWMIALLATLDVLSSDRVQLTEPAVDVPLFHRPLRPLKV